jgi:hypothetical protein
MHRQGGIANVFLEAEPTIRANEDSMYGRINFI